MMFPREREQRTESRKEYQSDMFCLLAQVLFGLSANGSPVLPADCFIIQFNLVASTSVISRNDLSNAIPLICLMILDAYFAAYGEQRDMSDMFVVVICVHCACSLWFWLVVPVGCCR